MTSQHGVNSNPPKQSLLKLDIEEILEDLGESYYPWHEYGDSYAAQNKEAIAEATQSLLTLIENIGIEAKLEENEYHLKSLNATPSEYNDTLSIPFKVRIAELKQIIGGDK